MELLSSLDEAAAKETNYVTGTQLHIKYHQQNSEPFCIITRASYMPS